jgi:hypothetical protein
MTRSNFLVAGFFVWPLVSMLVLFLSAPTYAHHSHANVVEDTIVIGGTVKEFEWANPHSWVTLEVVNEDSGERQDWLLEARAPAQLLRRGWKRDSLKPGDFVNVTIRPLRSGGPGGLVRLVTCPDGTELQDEQRAPDR